MPGRHRRSAVGGRRTRRKLVWVTSDQLVTVAAGTCKTASLVDQLHVAGASLLGTTIMRTHLSLQCEFAAVTDGTTFGLIVGMRDEIGTVRPDSTTQPEADWMWIQREWADASGAAINGTRQVLVDSRAKRKMDELDQVYLISLTNGNAAQQVYGVYSRTLLALP